MPNEIPLGKLQGALYGISALIDDWANVKSLSLQTFYEIEAVIQRTRPTSVSENIQLRALLWSTHPCPAKYGDDGELQCSACMIDFRRDSVNSIEERIRRRGRRLLEQEQQQQQQQQKGSSNA